MKIRLILTMFCVMAITPAVFAQTTIKLFDSIAITSRNESNLLSSSGSFGTAQLYLNCSADSTAVISGPDGGWFITDNIFTVNETNICPNGRNCFSAPFDDPMRHKGEPVENAYVPIAPVDISGILKQGTALYTFNLVDYSYTFGTSEIHLTTDCAHVAGASVCHRDYGAREQKTINVTNQSAINAHLKHGDTLGACRIPQ